MTQPDLVFIEYRHVKHRRPHQALPFIPHKAKLADLTDAYIRLADNISRLGVVRLVTGKAVQLYVSRRLNLCSG